MLHLRIAIFDLEAIHAHITPRLAQQGSSVSAVTKAPSRRTPIHKHSLHAEAFKRRSSLARAIIRWAAIRTWAAPSAIAPNRKILYP